MIKKIIYGWQSCGKNAEYKEPERYVVYDKINDLIDAINHHEDIIRQIGEWGSSKGECLWCENITDFANKDLCAEQKKWVGKLCRFWYSNEKYADLGILQAITPANTPNKYLKKDSYKWYSNCEPVLPDDDIIYKKD